MIDMANGDLPSTWVETILSEVGEVYSGGTPSTKNPDNFGGEIAWITPADLTGYIAKQISRGRRNITEKGLNGSGAVVLPEGTILFSSRAPIGYVAIAANDIATNQGFKNLVPNDGVNSDFIYWYLKGSKALAESHASGTTFREISGARFARLPVPIAPLNEQRRIVAKIEELFSKLDAGVAALEKAKALLKRYRQSVLKAAVTGELTRDWREANRDRLEPADHLLKRILSERRLKWEEAELAKMRAKGKEPTDDKWKAKYKEPQAPDTEGLPDLPDGWCWATVEQMVVAGPQNGLYLPQSQYGSGCPILRIDDFQNGWIRPPAELRKVATDVATQNTYGLEGRDLVINRVNSLSHLGKCAIVDARFAAVLFESNMMRAKLAELVYGNYVELYLHSNPGRVRLIANAKWAVNQASINQQDVCNTAIPLPPLDEQGAIVQEADRLLTYVTHVGATLEENSHWHTNLRQSILRQAFTGQLVPQDPNDEPASVLLERIKAERAAQGNGKAKRGRTKTNQIEQGI